MREGLRSRSRPGKGSGGGGVVQKKRVGVKAEPFDLGGEGLGDSSLMVEKKGGVEELDLDLKLGGGSGNVEPAENGDDRVFLSGGGSIEEADVDRKGDEVLVEGGVECGGKEERDLDLNVSGGSGDVDSAENGNDRSCFSSGGSIEEADVGRKGNGVLVGGRVLRSRSKRGDDKISYKEDNDDVFSGSDRECGGFERVKVKEESEGTDELLGGGEDQRVMVTKGGHDKVKLKRKRGRPPKTESKEQKQEQLVDRLTRKRGHKRKRGRPPKVDHQNDLLTVVHNDKEKAGLVEHEEDLTIGDGANVNAIDDMCSERSSGKELEEQGFSPVNKNKVVKVLKNDKNGVTSPLRSDNVKGTDANKRQKSKEKQLVRDKIMERLSSAGWTVDFRPRNGRGYDDSVYVSPDGKTHWSITLAYNRLKMLYEAGDGEGKVYGPGFKFTPIPEEEINSLTRIVTKTRNDKSKPRKDKSGPLGRKGGKTVDGVNRKQKKEKPGSGAVKGKMKRKRSLLEEGKTSVVVRDHKRHKTQNKKRCGLLVRNAKEEVDSETDGYVPYSGKRTLLAWMIDSGTVLQNGKVHYVQPGRKFDGKITGDGIHCGCCNKILTISDFEAHAESKNFDPLKNIYIEEGISLLQCLQDSWNKQDESERKGFRLVDIAGEDPNDDTCGLCGDGGDLICCDGCPSTFHQSCLDIKKFPSGDWHCNYCCCKFCGLIGGSSNQSETHDDFTVSALLTCHLCEDKYHRSCFEANGAMTLDLRDTFCGSRCQELSERLEMLLGVKHEIEDGFSWSFIRRSDVCFDASQIKPQIVECNSKLAVAVSIMDECFMPYVDHRSGSNLIHSILYNCTPTFNRHIFIIYSYQIQLFQFELLIPMASPEKKLGEFLKEQQEPFILEVYLLEKGCSRKLKRSDASSCFFKPLFPLSKVLTILHKKLHFQNRSKSALFRDPETRTEHAPHETVVELETDRFSTASSSTVFNSCSDVDEDGNSFWSHENNPLFSSDNFEVSSVYNMEVQSQQAINNGNQHQRCIEGSVTHEKLNHDVCVWGKEQRTRKITEDSLLSAALWSSLIQSAKRSENYTKQLQGLLGPNVSQVLKSKRVLHETKQLLFDCVREITMSQKGCNKQMVQFMGAENLGKVMWERTKEWCGNESLDDCANEWSSKLLKAQVMEICVEIADAILEGVNDEVVSEMIEIEILTPTM